MRILYITDALAVWGGIERVLRDKMNYLVEHYGYDIHVITTDQGDHPIPYPLEERIHVNDLNIRHHIQYQFHGINRLIKFLELNRLFKLRLKKAIDVIAPDIIVCIRIEMLNTILKVKGKIPLIYESHSMCYAHSYEDTSMWNRINLYISRKHIRKANAIVALTQGDANDWLRYNENVFVIPNVVNLNDSGRYSDLNSKTVIFVGRFSDQKDIWSLLRIWIIVHQNYPDWELHMYGEGAQKPRFIEAVKELNVNISVFSPTSDIFNKYLDSSIFVLSSRYEPFGLVLPEAMSCGLPVVAFNCPYGPADVIHDGVDGFLIEGRDIDSYARRLCELIDNQKLRHDIGKAAIQSSQRYSKEQVMPLWDDFFKIIQNVTNKE